MKTENEVVAEIKDFVDNIADADDLAMLWSSIYAQCSPLVPLGVYKQGPLTGDDIVMGE